MAAASTAYDVHPYPQRNMHPSRPDWVMGTPSDSTLHRRRLSTSSQVHFRPQRSASPPSPAQHSKTEYRRRTYLAPPTPHPHHTSSVHYHSRSRSHSSQPDHRPRSPPRSRSRPLDDYERTVVRRQRSSSRPSRSRSSRRAENWTVKRRSRSRSVYSSSDSDSDSDSDSGYDSAYSTPSRDRKEQEKKKRNRQLLYTGMACLTTVSAGNSLFHAGRAWRDRKNGGEGDLGFKKRMWKNAAALGVAGVVVNGARKVWVRAENARKA